MRLRHYLHRGNVWSYVNDIDQWYVGNNNPEVQNSVPMAFIYVDSTNNVFLLTVVY